MNENTLISTSYGQVQGKKENGISTWKGIPYAKPPIQNLRFKAPEPMEYWEGIKETTLYSPASPQISTEEITEQTSEDCLYLNIWSPSADEKKRPVMFWIHGGGYITGSGSISAYDGSLLAKNGDVVVVTINYRLGPFGFLYTKDLPEGDQIDSNIAFRDQLAALKWVKDNIYNFGGDPDNITIFGESAGGSSVINLLGSPLAKGLFHKAIAESPASYPTVYYDKATASYVTKKFFELLGINDYKASKLYEISTQDIVDASIQLVDEIAFEIPGNIAFQPIIGDDFLPEASHVAIENGNGSHVPLIVGSNQDEGTLFASMPAPVMPVKEEQIDIFIENNYPGKAAQIKDIYSNLPLHIQPIKMGADAMIWHSVTTIAEIMQDKSPTYLYRFRWSSNYLKDTGLASFHSLEIPFIFGTAESIEGKVMLKEANPSEVNALSAIMQTCWINFAHTGNPNGTKEYPWNRYNCQNRPVVVFDTEISYEHDIDANYREAWSKNP
ncbi:MULTISPECIES: carboxylesterase/lipase family protein [unclassified Sphingobacterium]|uniref:carboxylesterase/lipase family protein n=1 Tax=unclassified Sphingobacterium TaxID=2609468 RepID=UPI0025D54415|nr:MULTISPECIES: carboxylesterase/lipase family protein [unclassified Sphingobacterium]